MGLAYDLLEPLGSHAVGQWPEYVIGSEEFWHGYHPILSRTGDVLSHCIRQRSLTAHAINIDARWRLKIKFGRIMNDSGAQILEDNLGTATKLIP